MLLKLYRTALSQWAGMYFVCHIGSSVTSLTVSQKICENTIMLPRSICCFSISKPWITSDLKTSKQEKKEGPFRSGDKNQLWKIQHDVIDKVRQSRDSLRSKLGTKLQWSSAREVLDGMKVITGLNAKDRQSGGN